MKRVLGGLVVWTIAFAIGFGVANVVNRLMISYLLSEGVKALNEAQKTEISSNATDENNWDQDDIGFTPESKKHKFLPTYRACKPGYIQGYVTEDGQQLREGVALAADGPFGQGLRDRIRYARTRVFVANYRDYRGRVGERFILLNEPIDHGKETVTILFYDGGDYYRFIDAPTRDLALEFEQYLISIDLKSSALTSVPEGDK